MVKNEQESTDEPLKNLTTQWQNGDKHVNILYKMPLLLYKSFKAVENTRREEELKENKQ